MSHRWTEGAGEVELDIDAGSREDVFLEAAAALRELVAGEAGGDPVTRTVKLTAATDAELLAGWLEEHVFLVATESFVPESADVTLTGTDLDGTVSGRRGTPRRVVRAVTYHRLAFEHEGGAWRAHVVLDRS
jgi:SHS2 domain-containing protein